MWSCRRSKCAKHQIIGGTRQVNTSFCLAGRSLGKANVLGLRPLTSKRRVRASDATPDEWVANIGRGLCER